MTNETSPCLSITQLPEITNLEWEEWKEEGITINI